MTSYKITWGQKAHEWLKTVALIWAAFFIISEAVERKAKRELKKLRRKGIMGRWRNYRRARRSGEARRSFV